MAALEVKSTQALDYLALVARNKTSELRPCKQAEKCRSRALPQLGFIAGTRTPRIQKHQLKLREKLVGAGRLVPFPVGKGVATVVLAVDGRLSKLPRSTSYTTPADCLTAHRNCWSCVGTNFVVVTMPNAPGVLSLGGADGEPMTAWFNAYRRWTQALALQDRYAVKATLGALVETIEAWTRGKNADESRVLRAYWGSYLSEAARARGFVDVRVPGGLADQTLGDVGFPVLPVPRPEIPIRMATRLEFADALRSGDGGRRAERRLSLNLDEPDGRRRTLSAHFVEDTAVIRFASAAWWSEERLTEDDAASAVAGEMLDVVSDLSGFRFPTFEGRQIPLRRVVPKVDDEAVLLGWTVAAGLPRLRAASEWWEWWERWERWEWEWPRHRWRHEPLWPLLFALGDPRVSLFVQPDGRGELRLPRVSLEAP